MHFRRIQRIPANVAPVDPGPRGTGPTVQGVVTDPRTPSAHESSTAPTSQVEGIASPVGLVETSAAWVAAVIASSAAAAIAGSVYGVSADDLSSSTAVNAWALLAMWIASLGVLAVFLARSPTVGPMRAAFGASTRSWKAYAGVAALGVAAQFAVGLLYLPLRYIDQALFDELEDAVRAYTDQASGVGVLVLLALVTLGAPIAEEILYRGALLGALCRRWSWPIALWGQALIFGAVHLQPLQFPALVLVGVMLGLVRRRYGLVAAIVCHATFNLVAALLAFASSSTSG